MFQNQLLDISSRVIRLFVLKVCVFWSLLFLSASSFAQAQAPELRNYYLRVSDTSFASAQKIKNCAAYTTCVNTSIYADSGLSSPEKRIHIYFSATPNELHAFYSCYLQQKEKTSSAFLYQAQHKNKKTFKQISLPTHEMRINPFLLPKEVSLRENAPGFNEEFYNYLSYLISQKNYTTAIAAVVNFYQLATMGYRFVVKDSKFSVTVKDDRLIEVGTIFFRSPCMLIHGIRHELEHVRQYANASRCTNLNRLSDHNSHNTREKDAYLNDLINLDSYCSSKSAQNTDSTTSTTFENHLKNIVSEKLNVYMNEAR